ncbi:MAG: hypothetical protein PHV49_02100 [Alistipes sp.]|nr:hypothetical protein [Alistipes sp.]
MEATPQNTLPPALSECSDEVLEQWITRYPWFTAARIARWQRTHETLPEEVALGYRCRVVQHTLSPFGAENNTPAASGSEETLSDGSESESEIDPLQRIEHFLATLPQRKPDTERVPDDAPPDLAADSVTEDPDLISEELAEIYVQQAHYTKAKAIYVKLSLLYPEKSVYFAEIIAGLGASRETP